MKIIKSHWRNGVVGVEGPEDECGPLFVNLKTEIDEFHQRSSMRKERLRVIAGSSNQMPFAVN